MPKQHIKIALVVTEDGKYVAEAYDYESAKSTLGTCEHMFLEKYPASVRQSYIVDVVVDSAATPMVQGKVTEVKDSKWVPMSQYIKQRADCHEDAAVHFSFDEVDCMGWQAVALEQEMSGEHCRDALLSGFLFNEIISHAEKKKEEVTFTQPEAAAMSEAALYLEKKCKLPLTRGHLLKERDDMALGKVGMLQDMIPNSVKECAEALIANDWDIPKAKAALEVRGHWEDTSIEALVKETEAKYYVCEKALHKCEWDFEKARQLVETSAAELE